MIVWAQSIRRSIETGLKRPGVQEALLIAFLVLTLGLLGDLVLGSARYFAATVVIVAALAVMAIDQRLALLVLFVFLGAYEEFNLSSNEAFFAEGGGTSILTVRIFGVGILDFILIFFSVPVAIKVWYDWHTNRTPLLRPYDALMLPILLLWLYGIAVGIYHMHTIRAFTADIRDVGYILLFYVVVARIFTSPMDYFFALCALLGTVFLKTFLFMGRQFTGGGYIYGSEFSRTLLGSDTALVGILLASIVAFILVFDALPKQYKFPLIVLIFYVAMVLVSGLTRSTYLFTSIAIVFLFVLYRKRIRFTTLLLSLSILVTGALFFYYMVLSEVVRDLISYSLSSAFSWVDAIETYGDMSLGQRVLEVINIWETLSRAGMVFLGLGWGAAWTEVAVHHPMDIGAFPLVEQMTGVHTSAHIDAVQFMLKLGIIGMPLLYLFFLRYIKLGLRFLREAVDPKIQWTLLTTILMVIIFLPNFIYFARLKFLLAFAFAGIAVISYSMTRHEEHPPGIAHPHDA